MKRARPGENWHCTYVPPSRRNGRAWTVISVAKVLAHLCRVRGVDAAQAAVAIARAECGQPEPDICNYLRPAIHAVQVAEQELGAAVAALAEVVDAWKAAAKLAKNIGVEIPEPAAFVVQLAAIERWATSGDLRSSLQGLADALTCNGFGDGF